MQVHACSACRINSPSYRNRILELERESKDESDETAAAYQLVRKARKRRDLALNRVDQLAAAVSRYIAATENSVWERNHIDPDYVPSREALRSIVEDDYKPAEWTLRELQNEKAAGR